MQNKYQPFYIPLSIIIAGGLIALSIMSAFSVFKGISIESGQVPTTAKAQEPTGKLSELTEGDHIRGNKDAKILLVEYSDMECPFCKKFHGVLNQAYTEYGNQIGWVYRHFPLEQLHSKAKKEAEATECAYELGGDHIFWEYLNRIFEITPANNKLEAVELVNTAKYVGLNEAEFTKCLDSGKYADKVAKQLQSGLDAGVKSTPTTFIVTAKGTYPLTGATDYQTLKTNIEKYLNE